MNPKKRTRDLPAWLMSAPLYLFTLLFVLGPLVYMVVLFTAGGGVGCHRPADPAKLP